MMHGAYKRQIESIGLCVQRNETESVNLYCRHWTLQSSNAIYVGGSKRFRPDIQKPRQMENAVRDI